MAFLVDNWLLIALILILGYKNLPFIWLASTHIRFLRTLITRLFITPITKQDLRPEYVFLPAIHSTRSPLTECDYNIHKSNSTYFTDLDISRGNLSLLLFSQKLSFRPTKGKSVMILGGVQCVFKKEIKPYQGYELWSRVMSWDEKWVYIVSHFVERGVFMSGVAHLQGEKGSSGTTTNLLSHQDAQKKVFASAVSRYVFKQGRRTFPPQEMLLECGLLPENEDTTLGRSIEERRMRDLEAAQLKLGWDAVHESFDGDVSGVLGKYTDLLWR